MTPAEHYTEAERLLRQGEALMENTTRSDAPLRFAAAQVHATLANAHTTCLYRDEGEDL